MEEYIVSARKYRPLTFDSVVGQRIAELRLEIADYEERFDAATRQLKSLDNDPKALEQMAREKYYMKRANEDVFVIRVSDEDVTDETDTLDQDSIAQ